MTLFEKKREVSRPEARETLRKASPFIPGGGMLNPQERVELERKLFPHQEYGGYISDMEAKRVLRELRRKENQVKTDTVRLKTNRQRRFLENFTGLKGKY